MITKAYNLAKDVKRRKSGEGARWAITGAVLDKELKRIIGGDDEMPGYHKMKKKKKSKKKGILEGQGYY
tara:strand:+ start:386 stop:592 length:207 start_codon:yes stop_codon:yes gene_type:complete